MTIYKKKKDHFLDHSMNKTKTKIQVIITQFTQEHTYLRQRKHLRTDLQLFQSVFKNRWNRFELEFKWHYWIRKPSGCRFHSNGCTSPTRLHTASATLWDANNGLPVESPGFASEGAYFLRRIETQTMSWKRVKIIWGNTDLLKKGW